MVFEELINIPTDALLGIGQILRWLQALGIILVFWITLQITTLIINRKKRKKLYEIEESILRIEQKIDKLLKKK